MNEWQCLTADAEAQEALGTALSRALNGAGVVWLEGDLGAGKTTFTRGVLRGYGHAGAVKSPTYTLIEPYELADATVYHFDLYRLTDPEELELLGIRDYCRSDTLAIIEWPEKGQPFVPPADLVISIRYPAKSEQAEAIAPVGRELVFYANSDYGQSVLNALRETVSKQ